MGFVYLGIILIVISFMLRKLHKDTADSINLAPFAWSARVIALVMSVGGLMWASIVMVPAGYVGVKLKFMNVYGTMKPGFNLITPYINTVELLEIRTQKESSEATAASKDLQIVTTQLALNFHIDPSRAPKLFSRVGLDYKTRIIDPVVQESIKMVTAQYTAEELIKNRAAVKAEVESDITRRLRSYDIIVEPSGLSITNFNFSNEFNAAIEAKQVAQQEAEKQKYILQRAELERQTEVTKAKGASEAAKLNAQALQAQGGSKVLAREWIEKWDGHMPTVAGGSSSMMIDIASILRQGQ